MIEFSYEMTPEGARIVAKSDGVQAVTLVKFEDLRLFVFELSQAVEFGETEFKKVLGIADERSKRSVSDSERQEERTHERSEERLSERVDER